MSCEGKGKNKKKALEVTTKVSLNQKREIANKEGKALEKQVIELTHWASVIDGMDDEKLKGYLRNRPENLKTEKIKKTPIRKKVQRGGKSNTIMASVWKFHKEGGDEGPSSLNPNPF